MEFVVLGFGARGSLYADLLTQQDGVLKAVCELRPDRLEKSGTLYNLPKDKLFSSDKAFVKAGKLGDLCVVATNDSAHIKHALLALEAGYDLLLEKPMATKWEDCKAIYSKAQELKRRIFVCHVLRYAPFFSLIKQELNTGKYGRIVTINLTENVGYWHQAHSYVRGNWRAVKDSSPMIIAKSCHDLDIISWLVNAECQSVSSMGSLGYYKQENAPVGSSDRCLTCAVKNDCPYDAERFYITDRLEKGNSQWPVNVLCEEPTKEKVLAALKDGPYGRCVWKCDNDVVDHQVVNMEFDGGITAHLTMTAFSQQCYREIHVHCEKGEICGNMLDNALTCKFYAGGSKKLDTKAMEVGNYGHGGGDYLMIKDIMAVYQDQQAVGLTSVQNSMQSHAIGFAAEKSRVSGGKLLPPFKL